MGGELTLRRYESMSDKKVREQIARDTEEMGYESGHGYSGTWVEKSGINFIGRVFSSEREAEDYIADTNDKWGAVDVARVVEKKGTETQNLRIENQREKVRVAEQNLRIFYSDVVAKIQGVKAKTKKCKSCNTVHQVANIRSINCNSCGNSMLTETELKKEKRLKDKVAVAEEKRKTLISKRGGKTVKSIIVGGWCSS
jgi:hypothetical protein